MSARGGRPVTTVLKLGGSVITRKGEPETVDRAALGRAADAVADTAADLVLVHGGGSFGHPHADRHGLSREVGTHDATAVRAVHDAMCRLNAVVLDRLAEAGAEPLPIRPLSTGVRSAEGEFVLDTTTVEAMREVGFLPVLHGDVVVDARRGATVVSGDELVVALARALEADRVGLCTGAPGVLDPAGEVVPRVEAYEEVADALEGSAAPDVTGGMAGKVRALLDLDVPARVFGLDGLADFLAGGSPGTLVAG